MNWYSVMTSALFGCLVTGTIAAMKGRRPLGWAALGAALPLVGVVALVFVKDRD